MRVFICSRLRAPTPEGYAANIERAKRICRAAAAKGVEPYAPHLLCTQFLDDTDPKQREAGIRIGRAWMRVCQKVWVYAADGISGGMQGEIALARRLGKPVRFFLDEELTAEVYP
jgi:sugar phosphate isomerase/epimerase